MKFHFKGEKMIKIFKALKNAVRFFDLNPQGFSINEQKRNERFYLKMSKNTNKR